MLSCRLYATVVSTIKGYGDYFWVDVVEKIDEWGEQVLQYQNQCRKLPKALRDWQAYVDCRDTIDNFLEMLPLFQALAHKAMRERHWKSIMQITGAFAGFVVLMTDTRMCRIVFGASDRRACMVPGVLPALLPHSGLVSLF